MKFHFHLHPFLVSIACSTIYSPCSPCRSAGSGYVPACRRAPPLPAAMATLYMQIRPEFLLFFQRRFEMRAAIVARDGRTAVIGRGQLRARARGRRARDRPTEHYERVRSFLVAVATSALLGHYKTATFRVVGHYKNTTRVNSLSMPCVPCPRVPLREFKF